MQSERGRAASWLSFLLLAACLRTFQGGTALATPSNSVRVGKPRYLVGEVVSVDPSGGLLDVRETVRRGSARRYRFRILPSTRLMRKGAPISLREVEAHASVVVKYVAASSGSFEAQEVRVAEKRIAPSTL